MAGADWKKILSGGSPVLDLTHVPLYEIQSRIGKMLPAEREKLLTQINEEISKVDRREKIVAVALDVLKAAVIAIA